MNNETPKRIFQIRINVNGNDQAAFAAWNIFREKLLPSFPDLKNAEVLCEPYHKFPDTPLLTARTKLQTADRNIKTAMRLLGGKPWKYNAESKNPWAVWSHNVADVPHLHGARWVIMEINREASS